jgi:hypothetical protein
MRSRCSLVDILGEATALPVECQGEQEVSAMRPTPDKSRNRKLGLQMGLDGLPRIDVEKSAYHHQSRNEIGSDNPCSGQVSDVSDF